MKGEMCVNVLAYTMDLAFSTNMFSKINWKCGIISREYALYLESIGYQIGFRKIAKVTVDRA